MKSPSSNKTCPEERLNKHYGSRVTCNLESSTTRRARNYYGLVRTGTYSGEIALNAVRADNIMENARNGMDAPLPNSPPPLFLPDFAVEVELLARVRGCTDRVVVEERLHPNGKQVHPSRVFFFEGQGQGGGRGLDTKCALETPSRG